MSKRRIIEEELKKMEKELMRKKESNENFIKSNKIIKENFKDLKLNNFIERNDFEFPDRLSANELNLDLDLTSSNPISEDMAWLASKVFSDTHHGKPLTPAEFEQREALEEEYKEEITLARQILSGNESFANLSYSAKINVAATLISDLRSQKEKNAKTR